MAKSFEEYTVEELKYRLAQKDLPVSGTKAELIARLRGEDPPEKAEPEAEDEAAPEVAQDDLYERLFAIQDEIEQALLENRPDKVKAGLNAISGGIGALRGQLWEIASLERP
jgi:hypothetical protein